MMLLEAAAASERQLLLRIDQLETFSAHAGAAGDQVSMVLGHLSADMAALQARLAGIEQVRGCSRAGAAGQLGEACKAADYKRHVAASLLSKSMCAHDWAHVTAGFVAIGGTLTAW